MSYRKLDITVISADDLKDVGVLSKMDVYVTVSLSDDPRSKCRTTVDKDGGKSPKWNHRLNLFVYENSLMPAVIFTIRADRILSDKVIGEVVVPVKELLDSATSDSSERVVEYPVITPKGKTKGSLKFSYKFGEKSTQPMPEPKAAEPYPAYPGPATAYPAGYGPPPVGAYPAPPAYGYPQQAAPYGYPPQQGYGGYPPQQGYGGYPPQQGYGGYPPPAPGGYGGYPPQMVQAPQKKRNNMGLGLGLGAGLLGGLLVGDMISDIGDSSGGFGDCGGGFDF